MPLRPIMIATKNTDASSTKAIADAEWKFWKNELARRAKMAEEEKKYNEWRALTESQRRRNL